MNTRNVLLAWVLLSTSAGLAACAPAQPTEPAAVVQAAFERLNKGDVEGYMALVGEEAVLVDPHGRHAGTQAIREYLQQEIVPQQFRFELSNLKSDGNIVTYTAKVYVPTLGATPADVADGLTVVMDGRIVFDGTAELYDFECTKDPSQVFCAAS